MKKIIFLLLFFCNPLYSQSFSYISTSENQLELYKSNLLDLKDENEKDIISSTGADTLILNGESNFGWSVSTAGDVNGDGYSDVIVGEPGYNGYSGRAFIYYGGFFMDNIADVTMIGESPLYYFGLSVSTAGDVNGDGFSDVIVGADNTGGIGKAYIFYGGISMNNFADVYMAGESVANEFGISVSTAGDVNGDGFSDVIIGAGAYANYTGKAYIFYGGLTMNSIADIIMIGESAANEFGYSVSTAGDVNGDGFSDVIVGAHIYNNYKGRAYIYLGGVAMDSIVDVTMTGESGGIEFGLSVSTAGDVNGDGFSDVIVGAINGFGKAYIFYGGTTMNNISDITMTGESIANQFGYSVSAAGDVNGDGFSDVIISSVGYNNNTGRAYLFYGGIIMNNIPDVTMTGEITGSYFGRSVSSAGDLNGDGYSDVIIGSTSKAYIYKIENSIRIILKFVMEGMYSPTFNQLTRKDSVTVFLRDFNFPYNLKDSSKNTIDTNSFTGFFKFINASPGSYYIALKHLNSLETWSKEEGEYLTYEGVIYNYDFTNSNTQAYGNNLKLKGTKYCLYSGDVNQDGYITLFDVIPIYNDASSFVTGRFIKTDLTGDGLVDLTDVTLCYNNSANFIGVIRP